jgi:MFS family permease
MPRHRWVLATAAALGICLLIASVMPVLIGFGAVLVLCGGMFMTFAVLANTSVQLTAEPALRGRVMAVYLTFFLGGGALGGPLLGLLAEHVGPMRAIAFAGALGLVAAALGAVMLAVVRTRGDRSRVTPAVIPYVSVPAPNSPERTRAIVYQRDTETVDP